MAAHTSVQDYSAEGPFRHGPPSRTPSNAAARTPFDHTVEPANHRGRLPLGGCRRSQSCGAVSPAAPARYSARRPRGRPLRSIKPMPSLAALLHVAAITGGLLLMSSAVLADEYPVCTRAVTPEDVEAAKGMHAAGKRYYAKGQFEQAIQSWRSAYDFDCTAHPLLINIGNAYEKLGNTAAAIEAFDSYITRSGSSADPAVVAKRDALKQRAAAQPRPKATASTRPPPPTTAPAAPAPPPAAPPPAPPPAAASSVPVGPLALWIGGGASTVLGAVLLGVGVSDYQSAVAGCDAQRRCPPALEARGNRGRIMAPVGGVVMGLGLAAAGAGVVWLLLDTDTPQREGTTAPQLSFIPEVSLGPRGCSLGVQVLF